MMTLLPSVEPVVRRLTGRLPCTSGHNLIPPARHHSVSLVRRSVPRHHEYELQ